MLPYKIKPAHSRAAVSPAVTGPMNFVAASLRNLLVGAVVLTVVTMFVLPVHATLIEIDDTGFGSGAITRDSDTDLEWLDITYSVDRSFNSVSAQFGNGGDFEGFRYATLDEVSQLYLNAGFVNTLAVFDTANLDPVNQLAALIGFTFDDARQFGGQGMVSDTLSNGLSQFVSSFSLERAPFPNANAGYALGVDAANAGSTPSIGRDAARNFTGSFLVRQAAAVPEPTSLLLVLAGLISAVPFRRQLWARR